jgi:hypothetical protein
MAKSCTIVPSTNDCCGLYSEKGVPSQSLGNNGSIFISQTYPNWVYKKVNGVWLQMFKLSLKELDSGGANEFVVSSGIGQSVFDTTFDINDVTKVIVYSGGGGSFYEFSKTGVKQITTLLTVPTGAKVIIYEF